MRIETNGCVYDVRRPTPNGLVLIRTANRHDLETLPGVRPKMIRDAEHEGDLCSMPVPVSVLRRVLIHLMWKEVGA